MKRLIILLLLATLAGSAYGQHYDGRPRKDEHRKEQSHKPSKKKVEPKHRPDKHDGPARDVRSHGGFSRSVRREVPCDEEWQMLWNGCHVRLIMDWVYIYDDRDNRILSGDEIYLLPNGNYKVRKGSFWRIYDRKGDMTFVSGDEIRYWHPGFYAVRSGGSWHVCDAKGDRIFGVWGDSVELMGNGIFRCSRGGHYYYYDKDGNQRM